MWRTKCGLNSKLHAVCDEDGTPVLLHLTAGQVGDHRGAREPLHRLPKAAALVGDWGYDSIWFRSELATREIAPRIAGQRTECRPSTMTERSTNSAIKSKTRSPNLKTNSASPHVTISIIGRTYPSI